MYTVKESVRHWTDCRLKSSDCSTICMGLANLRAMKVLQIWQGVSKPGGSWHRLRFWLRWWGPKLLLQLQKQLWKLYRTRPQALGTPMGQHHPPLMDMLAVPVRVPSLSHLQICAGKNAAPGKRFEVVGYPACAACEIINAKPPARPPSAPGVLMGVRMVFAIPYPILSNTC